MAGTLLHTDSGFAGNLKNYYSRFRSDLFPLITPLFAQFQKFKSGGPRNMRWGGNNVFFDAVVGDPVGWAFSQAGNLPESEFRTEVQGSIGIRRGYVRQQIDFLTVPGTKDKAAAFVTIAQKIDEEMRLKFRLMMQEALHGDGTGVKATVVNVVDTTHIDVENPYGIAGAGQGALWIGVGSQITVRNAAGGTNKGSARVLAVSRPSPATLPDRYRLTLSAAVATVANTDLIVGGTLSDDSYGAVPNGVTNIVNRGGSYATGTAALHGIDTTVNPRWSTIRMVAGTDTMRVDALLESDLFELALRVAGFSGENAMVDPQDFIIVTTPGLKKSYLENIVGQRTLTQAQTRNLNGGYGYNAEWNSVPIIDDPYCPAGTVYLLHLPSLGWVEAKDFSGVEYEDSGVWRFIANKDAYETSQSIYFNVATTKRSAHAIITGYTDNFRYSPVAA